MRNNFKAGAFGNRGSFAITRGMARTGVKQFRKSPGTPSTPSSSPRAPFLLLFTAWIFVALIAYGILNLFILLIDHTAGAAFVLFLLACLAVLISILTQPKRGPHQK